MSGRFALTAALLVAVAGCHGAGSSKSTRSGNQNATATAEAGGCPVTTDVTGMSLGKGAKYTAKRYRSGVMIHASGQNATGGWENRLHASTKDIYPTRFEFYQKAPTGIVNQIVLPFDVCIFYPTRQSLETITVVDAEGDHAVKVED